MDARIVEIWVATVAGAPMSPLDAVPAVAGYGLVGDRYFGRRSPAHRNGGRPVALHITLIAREALEGLHLAQGIGVTPGATRRNLVTAGLAPEALLGQRFRIGDVLLHGVEVTEPCRTLDAVAGRGSRRPGWGGLRAAILESGIIRVGDRVDPWPRSEAAAQFP